MRSRPEILLVDDDPEFRGLVRNWLSPSMFSVTEAPNGSAALKLMQDRTFDVRIVDIIMPEGEGLETIQRVKRIAPECRLLVVSGDTHRDLYLQIARKLGADLSLQKPLLRHDLLTTLGRLASCPQ